MELRRTGVQKAFLINPPSLQQKGVTLIQPPSLAHLRQLICYSLQRGALWLLLLPCNMLANELAVVAHLASLYLHFR